MEENKKEKKTAKMSLIAFVLLIINFVLIIAIIYLCAGFAKIKVENDNTIKDLKQALKDETDTNLKLQKSITDLQGKIDDIDATINGGVKTETKVDGDELFKKILSNDAGKASVFAIELDSKDSSTKEFTDSDIAHLVYFVEGKTSAENDYFKKENSNVVISIDDLQKLAEKYFGREIDTSKAVNGTSISKKGDNELSIEVENGYGIYEVELKSANSIDSNKYKIDYKYDNKDRSLVVKVDGDNYQYVSFEK